MLTATAFQAWEGVFCLAEYRLVSYNVDRLMGRIRGLNTVGAVYVSMRLSPRLTLLCTLVILTGCNGLGGSPEATRTLSPAPVNNSSLTEGPRAGELAPGLTRDGITDSERLLRTHESELANTTYTRHHRVVKRAPNGSVLSVSTTRTTSNLTAVRVRQNSTSMTDADEPTLTISRWSANNLTYTAVTRGRNTTYRVSPVRNADRERLETRGYSASLSQILAQLSITVGQPAETGETRVYPLNTTEQRDLATIRNVTFTGRVTADGIVTEYRLEYRVVRGTTPIDVIVTDAVVVGSTQVEPPAWLATARTELSATTNASTSTNTSTS